MDWGTIVLVINILLVVAGWLLFQEAKRDLTARAAETPILAEVKALQQSVAGLLEQLKLESAQSSAQLEARCLEARDLLAALEKRIEEAEAVARPRRGRARLVPDSGREREPAAAQEQSAPEDVTESRRRAVYALADEGVTPAEIAERSGIPQGEVELMLHLRQAAR